MAEMNITAKRESLPAVTAAGIAAILFGVCGAFGSLLSAVSVMLLPDMQTGRHAAPMPPGFRAMSAVFMLFFLAIFVFGIFVGVGVLRRRNWARITILVWAGFMTLICVGSLAFSLVIFGVVQNQLPNVNPAEAAKVMQFTKIFLAVFYGIPTCVGIWWLILFTRKRVAAAFTNAGEYVQAMDPSGFPQTELAASVPPQPKPACPLPLAIFSVFLIFSSLLTLVFLLIPMPLNIPMFLFGHVFVGAAPRWIMGLIGLLYGVAGFGTLKLKPWAFYTELSIQCVFLVSAVLTAFSPGFAPTMRAAMQGMFEQNPAFSAGNSFFTDSYIRWSMAFGVVFCAAFVALLLFQRSRFLEAAAEAAKA